VKGGSSSAPSSLSPALLPFALSRALGALGAAD